MYTYCDPRKVRPTGWLLQQLQIQAKGMTGNLDKIWPDVRESAWIGGNKEGWERVPYWLDGLIPMAYLLDDADMKQHADSYMEAILKFQQEDGWICPCSVEQRPTYDLWSLFLIGKVLALYCEYADTEKTEASEKALYRAMKCAYDLIKKGQLSLFDWGKFRWFECMIPLYRLYQKTPEAWIPELAELLRRQGADYGEFCETWKRPLNQWTFHTHIVNLGMMFKADAVYNMLTGSSIENRAEYFWKLLEQYNGTAVSTFTGDECLSGLDSNRGTELCSVVELMYSCELLYTTTGDPVWMERLEKIAFNALPAAFTDDMWAHQYDQQVNQIACVRFPGKSFFRTNSGEAHLFGLEPHYGCCTANQGQGWPKLIMSVFIENEDGIEATMMLPAELHTNLKGSNVTIGIETDYPFRHSGRYTITTDKPVEFELTLRLPKWANAVRVNGETFEPTDYYIIRKLWTGTETIKVEYETTPHFTARPHGLRCVEYGPLVFSLPLEAEYKAVEYVKDGVERQFPYCDYELTSQSEWRYGFADEALTVVEQAFCEVPFSSKAPSIAIKANLSRVDWDFADGYDCFADAKPASNAALCAAQELTLIPYGCAKLRMTEMPLCDRHTCCTL